MGVEGRTNPAPSPSLYGPSDPHPSLGGRRYTASLIRRPADNTHTWPAAPQGDAPHTYGCYDRTRTGSRHTWGPAAATGLTPGADTHRHAGPVAAVTGTTNRTESRPPLTRAQSKAQRGARGPLAGRRHEAERRHGTHTLTAPPSSTGHARSGAQLRRQTGPAARTRMPQR